MNPRQSKERKEVEIKCVIWEKDSHGLFDYESKAVIREKHRIDNSCQIISSDTNKEILFFKENNNFFQFNSYEIDYITEKHIDDKEIKIIGFKDKIEEENSKILASISQKQNATYANTSEGSGAEATTKNKQEPSPQDAYLIVRTLKANQEQQKGYPMQVGDMIKLGRLEYCVIEKNTEETGLETTNDIFCDQDQYNFTIDYTKTETKTCRICLCEEEQCSENPLLNPCNCKGSCEYMHFECLKHWVESKVHKKQTPLISSFKWKNLECEVCKQPLPKVVNINNKKMSLIEVPRPEGNYLILEGISREKKVSKGLYIIHNLFTEEDSAKLGRGHQCDIRVQDISVSRCHSYIKFQNNQFLLFDNNSKFGTLVRLDKDYPILNEKVGIQVGRTVITFVLKTPISQIQPYQINSSNNIANPMHSSQLQKQQQDLVFTQEKTLSGTVISSKQRGSKLVADQHNQQPPVAYQLPQQFKGEQSMTSSNFYSQNPNVRMTTSSNIPSSTSQNSRFTGLYQQQQNLPADRTQQNTINPLNKSQKANTFISNAANNIIGANQPAPSRNSQPPSSSNQTGFNATGLKFKEPSISGAFNQPHNSQLHRNIAPYEQLNSSNPSSQAQGFSLGQSHTNFPPFYSNILQPNGGSSAQSNINNNPSTHGGQQNMVFSHKSNSNVQPSSLLPRNQRNLL